MTFAVCSPMMVSVTSELALPTAWLVKCKKCGCTINCRALHGQSEHADPERAEPAPQDCVVVTCSCCWAAYRYNPADVFKGPPGPSASCQASRSANHANNNNNKEARKTDSVLLIAASLIAAVRLNREEIKSSPVVYAKIGDSIRLAEMIQARLRG